VIVKVIKNNLFKIIVFCFICLLFIIEKEKLNGLEIISSIGNILKRFEMNILLVLSMIPMIRSGCGLNFGISIGIVAGILGSVISLEFNLINEFGIIFAFFIAIIFAIFFGLFYGFLLSKIDNMIMIISIYAGYLMISFMNIMWSCLPFKNPISVLSFRGRGLKSIISLENYWSGILDNFLNLKIKKISILNGSILVFIFFAILINLFFKTKLGLTLDSVGLNKDFAKKNGVDIKKIKIISVIISSVLASIGIIIYEQNFGFIQLYESPKSFTFSSIASILIGGANIKKANIKNAIFGTFLFQSIIVLVSNVLNNILKSDISEIIRTIISSGLILYAIMSKESIN
jgi:simple sugar transport system permease protein